MSLIRDSKAGDRLKLLLKELTREYTKKKTAEFSSHIAVLFDHLYRLLSDLEKIYQKKKIELSPNQVMRPTGRAGG